jgi:methyl-accepting chemotaxis protein
MSEFEKDVGKIKSRLKQYFWSKEEIEQIHFVKSMENFEHLNRVFEKITANEFIENLQHTIQQRIELFEGVIHHEQNALQKTSAHFNTIIKDSESSMKRSEKLVNTYDDISTSMKHISNRLDESTQMMRQVLDKLSNKEEELIRAEESLKKDIRELNHALSNISSENVKELYGAVLQNLEIMKSESAKVGYAFNNHLNEFDERYTIKLKKALEVIDSETAKIMKQITRPNVIDNR